MTAMGLRFPAAVASAELWWGLAPTPQAVSGPVCALLTVKKAETCQAWWRCGSSRRVRCSPWNQQLRAWPASAVFAVTCVSPGVSATRRSSGGPEAVCFARMRGKGLSCSLPGRVGAIDQQVSERMQKQMEKQMQKQMERVLRTIP